MLGAKQYSTWTAPDGRVLLERDSVSCAHCQRVLFAEPGPTKTFKRAGWCGRCAAVVCEPCAAAGTCTPFARRLEAMEARDRLRRAAGV